MTSSWDVIVVGAGAGGISTSIFAAQRGATVLVIDAAPEIGGALHLATGQLSAAGTRLQQKKGIDDTPQAHLDDIVRISKGTANTELVRLAVEHAGATLDWLLEDCGMPVLPDHPVRGQNHEYYSQDRYYWGPENGRSILTAIRGPFEKLAADGRITTLLSTSVTSLMVDEGAVVGVEVRAADGTTAAHRAANVVLATGGYNGDPEVFAEMNGVRQYADASWPYSTGAGHRLGQSVGGWTRGHHMYLCSFGSVLEHDDFPAPVLCRPIHWPEMRQPWEVYVNVDGERFIAEDHPSVDAREHALLAQKELRRFIILDDRILREAPSMIPGWSVDDFLEHVDHHMMFHSAATLPELGIKAGIHPQRLTATINAYNDALDGEDPLGRTHRPLPIAEPPFYSVRVQGMSITSTVGLAVDAQLRVITPEHRPVPGLYAIGELLGTSQLMGHAFCGGMLATPAMTFGRLLGAEMLTW